MASSSSSAQQPRLELLSRIERLVSMLATSTAAERDPSCAAEMGGLVRAAVVGGGGGGGVDEIGASVAGGRFRGARDLAGLLTVLRVLYEAALTGATLSQREVYYICAGFFSSAPEAYAALASASALLVAPRASLGVVASARGRVAGLVALRVAAGAEVDLAASGGYLAVDGEAAAAPPRAAARGARLILIVEKDALFQRLVEDRAFRRVPCILVTGCGMPDMATRALVHALQAQLALPVLALVDSNPWGLQIALTYALGSAAERRWAVPALSWLGLTKADAARYELPPAAMQAASAADARKARAMLEDPYVKAGETPLARAVAEELAAFLDDGVKMELEGLLTKGADFISKVFGGREGGSALSTAARPPLLHPPRLSSPPSSPPGRSTCPTRSSDWIGRAARRDSTPPPSRGSTRLLPRSLSPAARLSCCSCVRFRKRRAVVALARCPPTLPSAAGLPAPSLPAARARPRLPAPRRAARLTSPRLASPAAAPPPPSPPLSQS